MMTMATVQKTEKAVRGLMFAATVLATGSMTLAADPVHAQGYANDREQIRACMEESKALARRIHLPLDRTTVSTINRYCLRGDHRGALAYVQRQGFRSCMRSVREYVRRGGFRVDRRTWRIVERYCRSGDDKRAIATVEKFMG